MPVIRYVGAAIAAALTLAVVATSSSSPQPARPFPTDHAYIGNAGSSSLIEQAAGRPVEAVRLYVSDDRDVPTGGMLTAAAEGKLPVVTFKRRAWTWPQTASGADDAYWHRTAQAIKAWGVPAFVGFWHEMAGRDEQVFGTPTDFIAAWRHVVGIFRAEDVRNVRWTWVMSDYDFANRAPRFWPGDSWVNSIGIDTYSGCAAFGSRGELESKMQPVLSFARAHRKRIIISEFAMDANSSGRPAWIDRATAFIRAHPRIAIALWFNHDFRSVGHCDWSLKDSASLEAFARLLNS